MRRPIPIACLLVFSLAAVTWAAPIAQRGQRGGGRRGAQLSQEEVLESFDEIVEMIWTSEEENAWDDLDTDEERQAFIVEFWNRRDPTAGTETNEFRDTYMARVQTAMSMFSGEGTEGYKTARGKVFIIYGGNSILAQERKQVSGSATGGTDISGGDPSRSTRQSTAIIWTMNPENNPFLEGKEEIVFAQYQRSYSLSTGGIKLDQEAFLAGQDVQAAFAGRPTGPAAAGGGMQPGAPAAPPSADFLAMQALLREGTTRQDVPLQLEFSYFLAPDNNTYTIVAFEVGKNGLTLDAGSAAVKAFGVLFKQGQDGSEQIMREFSMDFTVSADEGTEDESDTHSYGMTLAPGAYRLAWGVMDNASERITTVSAPFEVPNFGASSLSLTSVLVAKGQPSRVEDPIDINTVYDGIRLGSVHADMDIDHVYGRNETVQLLYFVAGVQVDPTTQQPALEVDHRILDAAGNSIARLPTQTLNYAVIGQEIPLELVNQIEAGNTYTVEIHVTDTLSGNEVTQQVSFSVAGAGS